MELFAVFLVMYVVKIAAEDTWHGVKGTPNPRHAARARRQKARGRSRTWGALSNYWADLTEDATQAATDHRRRKAELRRKKREEKPEEDIQEAEWWEDGEWPDPWKKSTPACPLRRGDFIATIDNSTGKPNDEVLKVLEDGEEEPHLHPDLKPPMWSVRVEHVKGEGWAAGTRHILLLGPSDFIKVDGSRTRCPDGTPETEKERRFFDLRDSGYTGWIDQDGYPVDGPSFGTTEPGSEAASPAAEPTKSNIYQFPNRFKENDMSDTTTEIQGLDQAIAYARAIAEEAGQHGSAGNEGYIGHLTERHVSGATLQSAAAMQEAFANAAAAAEQHAVDLEEGKVVQEAYDQAPDSGDQEFAQGGR